MFARRFSAFERGGDQASPESLCENQLIPCVRSVILLDAFLLDDACDRVPKLDFIVTHRMPAEQRDSGFVEFIHTPAHDVAEYAEINAAGGKSDDGERGFRNASHRVNIA